MPTANEPGSSYITNCPTWWSPDFEKDKFKQARVTGEYFLKMLPVGNPDKVNGLLPWGDAGTGKTSGGLWVLYQWGKAGKLAQFQDFMELMDMVKACWNRASTKTVDEVHQSFFKPAILMLDDVGKRVDPEHQATLSTVVNGRINRGKPTIMTTNAKLNTAKGLAEFVNACDSRILERFRNLDLNMDEAPDRGNMRKDLHKVTK